MSPHGPPKCPKKAAAPNPVNMPHANDVPKIDPPNPVLPPTPAATTSQPPALEIAHGTKISTPIHTTMILIISVITVAFNPVLNEYSIATPAIKNVANV